jgi:neutral ceramidase
MRQCLRLLVAVACLTSAALVAAEPKPSGFRAGAATSNITPALGSPIVGNFLAFPATNIHDELHARCLVLDDGHTKLALVVLDLLLLDRGLDLKARELIEREVGIPAQNVLISAVHTHSATLAGNGPFPFAADVKSYPAFFVRRIVDGVKCAANLLRPAELAFTTVDAPEHVFNRRWFMKPGTAPPNPFGGIDQVKMNPPSGSADLVKPAGPTDPTVSILALREPNGRPIAVYSAYSLHYVGGVAKGDISADYYGMYCRQLERLMRGDEQDPPMVAMMANGTSGDVNNVNFQHPRPAKKPYEQMRFVADDLAAKVHAALGKAKYQDRVTLAARYREPTIKRHLPTVEQIAWAKQRLSQPAPEPGKVDLPYIYARRVTNLAGTQESVAVPLQVLRIGPVYIGTMPNEPFAEIGLEFRQRSPAKPAFLVELAHGSFGYLPTARHYALGGYETWLGSSAFEPHASEKMLDTLLEMVAEVRDAK